MSLAAILGSLSNSAAAILLSRVSSEPFAENPERSPCADFSRSIFSAAWTRFPSRASRAFSFALRLRGTRVEEEELVLAELVLGARVASRRWEMASVRRCREMGLEEVGDCSRREGARPVAGGDGRGLLDERG
eukprot:CAMPEP_0167779522 /NCGR_PEP_ID=MMETSP0111_2-20121227/4849_1 /TAXON_ID=91324 /ORGANISM="Lotharella globosa, Strain CCCM811" /LENGTH=132 /DNA_ID=CAMNT_0007669933 /DNA_START=42 /DNA_END=440 /DNA_ORIENTATION=-